MTSRKPIVVVSGRIQQIISTDDLALAGGLKVGGSSEFTVSATGDLTKINNIAYSWPSVQGVAGTVPVNNGSGVLTWAGGNVNSRELYYGLLPQSAAGTVGDHIGCSVSINGSQRFEFDIPADFMTLVALELILIPGATNAAANVDLASDYGAVGQLYNNHSETNTTITFSWTLNTIFAMNISSVFSSLAAGDHCGIFLSNNSVTSGYIVTAVHLKYTV